MQEDLYLYSEPSVRRKIHEKEDPVLPNFSVKNDRIF